MEQLLAKATQGVDMNAPDAYLHIFINLMAMIPWTALFWWNLAFVVVGALLGWWRGKLLAGVIWALVRGPIGWVVVLFTRKPAKPPPLPR